MIRRFVIAICPLLAVLCLAPSLQAQSIVLLHSTADHPYAVRQLREAADYYGLQVEAFSTEQKLAEFLRRAHRNDVLAVAITGAALEKATAERVLPVLQRNHAAPVPLLIFAVTPSTGSRHLAQWSHGLVSGCSAVEKATAARLTFAGGPLAAFTKQLAGQQFQRPALPECVLRVTDAAHSIATLSTNSAGGTVMAQSAAGDQQIFFLAAPDESRKDRDSADTLQAFTEFAPLLIAVRSFAGEYGWHPVGHFANLSIDDPWLTEPYGNLNYRALLGEMEKHNFHTTIAFIPWNFDRNRPEVVELIRKSPRYSIAIHGNNHNHAEFRDYAQVPLEQQEQNLKQALARMERFHILTGIPYERVMVFPHSIAPEPTLAMLKRYGYAATANGEAVPPGAIVPEEPIFQFRNYSLRFGNMTAMTRYSVEGQGVNLPALAMASFLELPMLYYGHEKMFAEGITYFNKFADAQNSLTPGTRWCSLGCIAQHLYLVKRRPDGAFDVRLETAGALLENPSQDTVTYYVEKPENFTPEVLSVTLDGIDIPYTKSADKIAFTVVLGPGEQRKAEVHYPIPPASADVSKHGWTTYVLRYASDFRDIYLSRISFGRGFTRWYYNGERDGTPRIPAAMWIVLLLLPVLVTARLMRRGMSRKSSLRQQRRPQERA